jgi:hypothetical protein
MKSYGKERARNCLNPFGTTEGGPNVGLKTEMKTKILSISGI